jgi:hypothetical protein
VTPVGTAAVPAGAGTAVAPAAGADVLLVAGAAVAAGTLAEGPEHAATSNPRPTSPIDLDRPSLNPPTHVTSLRILKFMYPTCPITRCP